MNMNILYLIILVILCGYIFGVVVVSVIKNNLRIEPFTQEEESPSHKYKSDLNKIFEKEESLEKREKSFEKEEEEPTYVSLLQKSIEKKKAKKSDESDEIVIKKKEYIVENLENERRPDGYSQHEPGVSVWNFDYEKHDQIKNICFKDHEHGKNCPYGHTNYADPRTMSVVEKRTFTLSYPPNMTLQDYVNWLYAFVGREDQLPYNHLKYLEQIKRGIPLIQEDGVCPPSAKYFPPVDAEKYFQNMYDAKTKEIAFASPLNSTTSVLLGANYDQYSEFSQNADLYGLSGKVVNPDIPYKKTAESVDNVIIPKNGNDLEITAKYKPYYVKKSEA